MGRVEVEESSLLEVVVRMRRVVSWGRREVRREVRSAIGVEARTGRESVEGRLRPGKEVRKTLMVWSAMTADVRVSLLRKGTFVCVRLNLFSKRLIMRRLCE